MIDFTGYETMPEGYTYRPLGAGCVRREGFMRHLLLDDAIRAVEHIQDNYRQNRALPRQLRY